MFLDFGSRASILAPFSLWEETGSKSRKRSIYRFRGWGGLRRFLREVGVGGRDPK